ncbi:MAG TPA: hypothetical protein VKB81_04660 [Nitrospira sp.]|nr:hypothetical protein [Nitrospira sp.]
MTTASVTFDERAIPAFLKQLPQWVCWRPKPNGSRMEKIPVNADNGKLASTTDPTTWTDFRTAIGAAHANAEHGIGYVLHRDAGIVGVDLDKCRDADTGHLDPWADEVVRRLNTYTEISPSGTGLHLLMRGTLPPGSRKKGRVEAYEHGRFFTVTGQHLKGTPMTIEARTPELAILHARYLADARPVVPRTPINGTPHALLSDDEILTKCRAAKNAAKFEALWQGDWSGYASQSEADSALIFMLAFYSRDSGQLDRLFRQSRLFRDKWDERRGEQTYGEKTIMEALANVRETYSASSMTRTRVESATEEWPALEKEAFHGLVGAFVRDVGPYSEADPVAMLLHMLVAGGVMIGPRPHALVEHQPHYARTNLLLVGRTAGGRKGTAWSTPKRVLSEVEPDFVLKRVKSGLSS